MQQKQGKRPPQRGASDLGELDAIVVNIFNSLNGGAGTTAEDTGGRSKQTARSRQRPLASTSDANVVHGEAWAASLPPETVVGAGEPLRQRDPASPRPSRTSADRAPAREAASPGCDPYAEGGTEGDVDFLLNEEEEGFIERTVAWLKERPNPDILLDRIWNRLIDLTEEEEARISDVEDAVDSSPDESAGNEEGET